MAKVARDPAEFLKLLENSVAWLRRSAEAFDAGAHDEARRLATVLRVLLHDTAKSKSLLGQLGKKMMLLNSGFPAQPGHVGQWGQLLLVEHGPTIRYRACLDDGPPGTTVGFDTWWNTRVLTDGVASHLTRRDLVLGAANQDGGAHVDPMLDADYARFIRDAENALGGSAHDELGAGRTLGGGALESIRQIAHEVLKSLDPQYEKRGDTSVYGYSSMMTSVGHVPGGISVAFVDGPGAEPNASFTMNLPAEPPPVGLDEPCPCGVGLAFKACHGNDPEGSS